MKKRLPGVAVTRAGPQQGGIWLLTYVLRRILNLVFPVFLVVSFLFLLFRLLLGDPGALLLGSTAT